MAEKRMFSKAVISSAKFLRLPPGARLLFYDLGMEADDDGFVEAFTVMRKTAATEADLQALAEKDFVVILNDELVSWLPYWKDCNTIRADRYKASVYKPIFGEIIANFAARPSGNQLATNGIPTGNQWLPQSSLGKISIEENSLSQSRPVSQVKLKEADRRTDGQTDRQTIPSFEEIKRYAAEIGATADPEKFWQYNKAGGWHINGNPIRDWKKAFLSWEAREAKPSSEGIPGRGSNKSQCKEADDEQDQYFAFSYGTTL